MGTVLRKSVGTIAGPLLYAATVLLVISSSRCYAESCINGIAGPSQPTITSISPNSWPAGQTITVTITGVFTENADPMVWPGCDYTEIYVSIPAGGQGYAGGEAYSNLAYGNLTNVDESSGGVLITNIVWDNTSQTTFTITIPAGAGGETASINIGNDTGWNASATVQIGCPAPTISSISPNKWFAGEIYDGVVIKGTGFITTDKATAECPTSQVNISAADGSAVQVSGVNVVDKIKITATVAPAASEPAQTATVTVGTSPNTAQATAQIKALTATITDTGKLMDGIVNVKLVAPSATSGDLTLNLYGSNNQGTFGYPSLTPGSQDLKVDFSTPPDIYSSADGTWDAILPDGSGAQSVSIPTYQLPKEWDYFRSVRFSQYNVPNESACSGGSASAWIVDTSCNFTQISLEPTFISQAWLNGTGISISNGILQNATIAHLGDYQRCAGKYPKGAIGHGAQGGNTFVVVSEVKGACGKELIGGVSAARPILNGAPQPLSNVKTLSCGDKLNMDSGNYTSVSTQTIADSCPGCGSPANNDGADGHIDSYTSDPACSPASFGDVPGSPFYTSNITN